MGGYSKVLEVLTVKLFIMCTVVKRTAPPVHHVVQGVIRMRPAVISVWTALLVTIATKLEQQNVHHVAVDIIAGSLSVHK